MWKTLKALVVGLLLFVALPHGPASAQTTKTALNASSWTNVGTGPLFLSTIGHAWYAVSSTTPSLVQEGFPVPVGGVAVNTSEIVWARLDTDFTGNAYTYGLVAGSLTFSWPGNCGNGVIGAAATAGCTVPYINTYSIGGSSGVSVFTPSLVYSAPLAVTTASAHTPFPAGAAAGSVIKVTNRGPSPAYWTIGPAGSVVATPSMAPISPNSTTSFTVPATGAPTDLAAITANAGQTATINMELGNGLPSDTGGPFSLTAASGGQAIVFSDTMGGADNSTLSQVLGVTLPGVTSTKGFAGVQGCPTCVPVPMSDTGMAVSHASTTALANSLNAKATAGSLVGFNCTAITGAAAGYCVVYNAVTPPSAGALTGTLVLDFCQFDTTARGCSLGRAPAKVTYSIGMQVLVTSAASPYTYTTGVDTAAISADFQ